MEFQDDVFPGTPVPPLFACQQGDIFSYSSVAEAESHLEAIDLRDGTTTGYDALGRLLRFSERDTTTRLLWFSTTTSMVSIALDERQPSRLPVFRAELIAFVRHFDRKAGRSRDLESLPLSDLVALAYELGSVDARRSRRR
jgi:hypothetical protein